MDTYSYLRREGNMHMGTRATRYIYTKRFPRGMHAMILKGSRNGMHVFTANNDIDDQRSAFMACSVGEASSPKSEAVQHRYRHKDPT